MVVPGRIMVLDTETTGFPPKAPPHCFRSWQRCRMLELAWQVYHNGSLVKEASYLIIPDLQARVHWAAVRVHGITHELATRDGHPIANVLEEFCGDLEGVSALVGHNVQFDLKVINHEIHRHGHEKLKSLFGNLDAHCTMLLGKKIVPNKRKTKLSSLHEHCFGCPPKGRMHRALADVRVTAKLFFHMLSIPVDIAQDESHTQKKKKKKRQSAKTKMIIKENPPNAMDGSPRYTFRKTTIDK